MRKSENDPMQSKPGKKRTNGFLCGLLLLTHEFDKKREKMPEEHRSKELVQLIHQHRQIKRPSFDPEHPLAHLKPALRRLELLGKIEQIMAERFALKTRHHLRGPLFQIIHEMEAVSAHKIKSTTARQLELSGLWHDVTLKVKSDSITGKIDFEIHPLEGPRAFVISVDAQGKPTYLTRRPMFWHPSHEEIQLEQDTISAREMGLKPPTLREMRNRNIKEHVLMIRDIARAARHLGKRLKLTIPPLASEKWKAEEPKPE